jgi:hypothetical protein
VVVIGWLWVQLVEWVVARVGGGVAGWKWDGGSWVGDLLGGCLFPRSSSAPPFSSLFLLSHLLSPPFSPVHASCGALADLQPIT